MAGGWEKQGSGIPLSQRVRFDAVASTPATAMIEAAACPARHCWVADAVDGHGVKRPGLLVEWRQVQEGWEGRVMYAAQLRPDTWMLVEEWLPAALLAPM